MEMSAAQEHLSLPEPQCKLGYPTAQVEEILSAKGEDYWAFNKWMTGQTMGVCDGREYNHEAHRYEPTHCGPHGIVVYGSDIKQYLAGGAPLD